MTDILIWGGPVSASDIAQVAWADPKPLVVVVNHGPDGGIGSGSFAKLAIALKANGRLLPNILAAAKVSPSDVGKVAIAGFSAFHGLASPLLLADGDSIGAAFLFDSCFSDTSNPPKAGYVDFAARAARSERLMVMTASAGQNGPGLQPSTTGFQCALANASAGCAAAGKTLDPSAPPAGIPPTSQGQSYETGDLFVFDYRGQYQHGDHVHKLAVPILNAMAVPWFASGGALPDGGGGMSGTAKVVIVTTAALAVAAGVALVATRKKR